MNGGTPSQGFLLLYCWHESTYNPHQKSTKQKARGVNQIAYG